MRPAIPVAFVAALALGGCAATAPPRVDLPAAFDAPAPGEASADAAAAVDLDRWWTAFGDESLTRLVEEALVSAPDARTAAARLREVRASAAAALTSFLPQGSANGTARRTDTRQLEGPSLQLPGYSTSGVSEAYGANFNVSWEVDLFGRLIAARRTERGQSAAARFAYEGARASLAAGVADAYFQARGLAIQLADAQQTVRIQKELYRIADERSRRGLASSSDADRVAAELARAEGQARQLEAELRAAKRSLLVLTGRGTDPLDSLATPASVGVIPTVPATLPSQLLVRRPDIRESLANLRSQGGQLLYRRLAFLPTLTFTPGLGWTRNVQPGLQLESQNWSLGGGVSMPVLDIPRLLLELRAQNARVEQAVIAYEKTVQTAFGEAESALNRLEADRRQVELLSEGEARAARAYEAAQRGYGLGLVDLQTTLGAEQTWRATRSQHAAAQVQGLRRAVQTYKALGGGWPAQAPSSSREAG